MGSVAPPPDDTFSGFIAVRSREDAEAREIRRLELQERRSRSVHGVKEEKTDEDWMVGWEEGEKANPKVRSFLGNDGRSRSAHVMADDQSRWWLPVELVGGL
jgi:hypothetical protein